MATKFVRDIVAKKRGKGIKNPELVKKKQRQIAVGASEIIFQKGFHNTSVRELAEYSGLTIGNLYDYINTKDDILFFVFNEIYERWASVLLKDSTILAISNPKRQLISAIDSMWEVVEDMEKLLVLAYRETNWLKRDELKKVLAQESRLVSYFDQIILRGMELGEFRKVDSVLTANTIVFLLAFLPLRGWNFRKDYNYKKVKSFVFDLIFNGILEKKSEND